MNIEDIKSYIISYYPTMDWLFNGAKDTRDACEDFFYYYKLEWCSCGTPLIAMACIRDYLRIVDKYSRDKYDCDKEKAESTARFGGSVYENELLLCLAYALNAAGFTEHGSGIGASWLTNEGKMFLQVLNENQDLD